MASCDFQATLSNNKLENITECPSKVAAPSKITDTSSAIASAITQIEAKPESVNNVGNKIGHMLQPTKIPAPIHRGNGFRNRKYTTLMKTLDSKKQHNDTFSSTSTLVNTTVDSGIQMDSSTAEDDNLHSLRPGSLTPRQYNSTETMVSSDSIMELEAAERQTLRVLQRAVAEMEADVALHSAKLEQEIKLDVDRQLKQAMVEQQQQQEQELDQHKVDQTEFKDMLCAAVEIPKDFPIGTGAVERKLVRVEELLDAEHNMEMLHKLLQKDNQLVNSGAPDLPLSGDNLSEVIAPREDEGTEAPRKPVGLVYTLLQLICGKGIRRLSYPILLCGMAVGLLFYFRKE